MGKPIGYRKIIRFECIHSIFELNFLCPDNFNKFINLINFIFLNDPTSKYIRNTLR